MNAKERIERLLDQLIAEGHDVLNTKWHPGGNWVSGPPSYVDLAAFSKWRAKCKLLASLLAHAGRPWETELTSDWDNRLERAIKTLGTLEAIRAAIADGLLLSLADLILAEAFSNLVEQAEYLLKQGYVIAAGVILRAILEERLRELAERHGITMVKSRPTLNDWNAELYKSTVYDKITYKDIDALAAIGNDAAHNKPGLAAPEVERLKEGVTRVLQRFSR